MLFRDALLNASEDFQSVLDQLEDSERVARFRHRLDTLAADILDYAAEPARRPRLHDAA